MLVWLLLASLTSQSVENLTEHVRHQSAGLTVENASQVEMQMVEIRQIAAQKNAWQLWELALITEAKALHQKQPHEPNQAFIRLLSTRRTLAIASDSTSLQDALERARVAMEKLPRGRLKLVSGHKGQVKIDGQPMGEITQGALPVTLPYGSYWLTLEVDSSTRKTIAIQIKDKDSELVLDFPSLVRKADPKPLPVVVKNNIYQNNEQKVELRVESKPWYRSEWTYVLSGVATLTGAGLLIAAGYHQAQLDKGGTVTSVESRKQTIDALNISGGLTLAVGTTALLGTLVYYFTREPAQSQGMHSVSAGPTGVSLSVGF